MIVPPVTVFPAAPALSPVTVPALPTVVTSTLRPSSAVRMSVLSSASEATTPVSPATALMALTRESSASSDCTVMPVMVLPLMVT